MSKEKLIEMLRSLPIYKPKVDQVKDLFPHLTIDEIKEVLTIGGERRSNYVAIPPLRIDGAFQIVSFNPKYKSDKGKVPVRLSWSNTGRTRESYADGRSRDDVFHPYKHMEKAITFARQNWACDLVLDDWVDFIEIHILDPTDLHKFSVLQESTKAVVSFTTTRPWSDIINDHSKPKSQVIDDAIAQITTDYLIAAELKGTRGGYIEFTSRDDQLSCSRETPLPSKINNYLIAQGFRFRQDPAIARQKEAQRFEQCARRK